MAVLWVLLPALLGSSLVMGDDSCPTRQSISPCTCDGEGMNCMGSVSLDQVRKAFKADFKYNGVRSVWIQGTPLTSIPDGLFGNIRSQQFYIEVNNITSMDVNSMKASHKTLNLLSAFGNKLTSFPFKDLTRFERLGTLNLGRNLITEVPDDAFNHRYLYTIILTQNRISTIGKNAFAKLPNLANLALSSNVITTLGPKSISVTSASNSMQINLAANLISEVHDTAFEGTNPHVLYLSQNKLKSLSQAAFSKVVVEIARRGGALEVSNNPLTCKGCDYNWIILNKESLAQRLAGFRCPDGRGVHDLRKVDIGC